MLINDNNQEITTIQIKKIINAKNIECKSEDGELVKLHLTKSQKSDPLFWWSLVKIYTAQLWIPIMKNTQTLLSFDWLTDSATI